MATRNRKTATTVRTHEGAPARDNLSASELLRRSVMACMLWEGEFYEDGESIAERIDKLAKAVDVEEAKLVAIEARHKQNLRHVPLLVANAIARKPGNDLGTILPKIIMRPDELAEFVKMHFDSGGKKALTRQIKKGLAKAFVKFDEYQLAKYNRDNMTIKLRDVLFLCHAKAKDQEQEALWKRLINDELKTPDTWEVALSTGENKKDAWERLLRENKLGALALLRNIRNMESENVNKELLKERLFAADVSRILPFRFVAAANFAPAYLEPIIEKKFLEASRMTRIDKSIVVLVDVSGSMVGAKVSKKSDMDRLDAAAALAAILRETSDDVRVFAFSDNVWELKPRRGFALIDEFRQLSHGGTYLGQAVSHINKIPHGLLVVITDEQSHDAVPGPNGKGYMINVASYDRGIGYGAWTHLDGFSESIVKYIAEAESQQ